MFNFFKKKSSKVIDNFYIISKNTASIYSIISIDYPNLSEKDKFFLAGVVDAYVYISNYKIQYEQIYSLSRESSNLEDFIFNFTKLLMLADNGEYIVNLGYGTEENISRFKMQMIYGIEDSIKYDIAFKELVNKIYSYEHIQKYLGK